MYKIVQNIVLRFICSFILVTVVCLFAVIVDLISFRFGFHVCLNSEIFLFVLSLICIFNLSFTCFENYLFIYTSTCCKLFAMIFI